MMPSQNAQEFYSEAMQTARRRSNWCEMRPLMRNRVFKCAMAVWPVGDIREADIPISQGDLQAQVRAYYQQVYGNPIVMMILSIIIKIVIELIIEWWKNRENTRVSIMECAALCNAAGVSLDQCLE
jgi:hypothetical protein